MYIFRMNNVAKIRKSRNLTQYQLADLVGVEQPTISRLERGGGQKVSLKVISAVAEALGVGLADLFSDRTEAENYLIEVFRSLPDERQKGWLDMARAAHISDPQSDT